MFKRVINHIFIPMGEIRVSFARSSGAGGQNVNKVSTKAILHWPIGNSKVFTLEEKDRIRKKLENRINNNDELVIDSEKERSQLQNKELAISRLQALVARALEIEKKRQPIRVTRGAKLRMIEFKRRRSQLKEGRRKIE